MKPDCILTGLGKDPQVYPSAQLHRKVLEFKMGRPLAPGMYACHTCDTPGCINPEHLYEGTQSQNMLDRFQRATSVHPMAAKTHCVHGHEYTPENTLRNSKGYRTCLACREASRKTQRRRLPRKV